MSFAAAVDFVEATLKCYRNRAISLLREAVDKLQVNSRTRHGPLLWVCDSLEDGSEILYSDRGEGIEVSREGVLRLCSERTGDRAQPLPAEPASNPPKRHAKRREEGICSACRTIWPTGIPPHLKVGERNRQIRDWLKESGDKQVPEDISQQVRRAVNAHPELLQGDATQGQISKPEPQT